MITPRLTSAQIVIQECFWGECHLSAQEILDRLERFAVPELFAFEVFPVLQRLHPNWLMAFRKGIVPLLQGGIFRQPMTEGLAVKASPFVKLGLSGYDACYTALARELKGIWFT